MLRFRGVGLGVIAGLAALAVVGVSRLRFDFTPQEIFRSADPEFRYLEGFHETFGRDDNVLVVLVRSPRIFSPEGAAYLRALHEALAAVDGVDAVNDLTHAMLVRPGTFPPVAAPVLPAGPGVDYRAIRAWATGHPLLAERLVDADGDATLVLVRIADDRTRYEPLKRAVLDLQTAIESVEPPAGFAVEATGIPIARVEVSDGLLADWFRFAPVCSFFVVVVLYALLRDLRAVAVALSAVFLADLYVIGSLGAIGMPINVINNVLPTLILVIGVSDGIHLIVRYRDELAAGADRATGLGNTIRHLAVACLLTSLTTAVGFASLVLARVSILQEFGLVAAAGVMGAYVVTIVYVPFALSYLSPILPRGARDDPVSGRVTRWIGEVAIRRWPWVACLSLAITAGAAWLGRGVEVENNLYEAFDADHEVVRVNRDLERDFGGVVPGAVAFEWDEGVDPLTPERLALIEEAQAFVEANPYFGASVSIVDFVKEWNASRHGGDPAHRRIPETAAECRAAIEQMRAFLTSTGRHVESRGGVTARGDARLLDSVYRPERRILQIAFRTGDHGAKPLDGAFTSVTGWLDERRGTIEDLGFAARLTGDGPVASRGVTRLILDLLESLLLAFVVILVTMCVLFRSIKAGLVSMIPNLFPLFVTLGFLGLTGMDLRVATVIVFTISLGLAVDDTIHFMVRFKEEYARGVSYEEAMRRTFAGTGKAIVTTSVLLSGGYASLLLSEFPITRTFALCMQVTVWAALAGDLFILPVSLLVFRPFARERAGE